MSQERFQKLAAIFEDARELETRARNVYLDKACADEPGLRSKVVALLGHHDSCGVLDDPIRPANLTEEPIPERIGHFRILDRLGRGGMGVVYRAEQDQPSRQVALKMMHAGLNSEELRRRFEFETSVLARLQHPGIAQIYEVGTWDVGSGERPYFAMELVDGDSLDAFVGQTQPSIKARLQLFTAICDAVHHAHQKGVIHRDLKPANILVTSNGTTKILDFGVARATDADLQATMYTTPGQLVGTLAYMSPEQVDASTDRLDTRSDVYALGVILYELLAEQLPYQLGKGKIASAIRVIEESEPKSLTLVSRSLRGDMNTIVLKSLQKRPEDRYQSASDLAADIRRFLSYQPIVARPATTLYQLSRFARRNRALVGGIVATFITLIIGVVATTSQMVRATNANRQAQAERVIAEGERNRAVAAEGRAVQDRAQAEAVTNFLTEALASADPEATLGREMTVREMLDRASTEIDSAFSNQPQVEAAVRATIGRTYLSIGKLNEAEQQLKSAMQIRQERLKSPHADLASSIVDLGMLLEEQGDYQGAAAKFEEALAMLRELYGDSYEEIASTEIRLGRVLVLNGKYQDAERPVRDALTIIREIHGDDHESFLAAQSQLAEIVYHKGDVDTAEKIFRENIEAGRRIYGEGHPSFAHRSQRLGWFYFKQGRYDEALPYMREAVAIHRTVYGDAHPILASALNSLARIHQAKGSYDESEAHYREALAVRRAYAKGDHPDVALSLNDLGTLKYYKGDENAAIEFFRESLEMNMRVYGRVHSQTAMGLNNLAIITSNQGDTEQAVVYLREVVEIQRKLLGDVHPDLALGLNNLARELQDLKNYDESEKLFRESLAIRRELHQDAHPDIAVTLRSIGDLMMEIGNAKEAVQYHRESASMMRKTLGNEHAQLSSSLIGLGGALINGGDAAGAESHLQEAIAIREGLFPEGHWKIASARSNLGACMTALERFVEAEPLLLAGYNQVKQQKGDGHRTTRECLQRVVNLYESWAASEPGTKYAKEAQAWRAIELSSSE